ncbi:hypothetical protein LAZ67_14003324 [Cordylochernes scorpioides]|uniref:Mos1 transposase HTH domain-containing protein n=1 Tax=Cordylochernes scorpioides TaxID=51811 RepID=A0ABY6L7H6_9ARAC|nr:hypothetical protein LAZ67_14003324 [Cordylochernes scorpioides]
MILGKNAQNVQKITDLIIENPRTTFLELEQDTGISKTTIGRIVTEDLKLKKTPAKFIPRFLTNEQKLCRLATCENMLEMTRTDPEWKDKIITGDETWVYGYDPEIKRQSAKWNTGAWVVGNRFVAHAPKQREQRLFKVKPFCPCFDIVSHRNGVSKNLLFCVKNGFKGADIFWMLQTAYGDAVMSRRRVFEWYKRFKEGREETADNECYGRPSISTTPEKVDKVLELVREERRMTVREVAEEAGISFGLTQSKMENILGVRRLNAVLVPKDLTFDQKNARKETASLNLEATGDDPELLKRVITGDETWIYGFDSETTQQASEWCFKNVPRPKKARKAPSKVNVMLTVFFDYQGIFHHEFQQQGSTITADSYLGVLRRLREAIKQKRPELWRSKSWILLHDNAPAHTELKISKFLQDHSTSVFPQPPTVPIRHPANSSSLEAKKKSKGRKYQSIEEI